MIFRHGIVECAVYSKLAETADIVKQTYHLRQNSIMFIELQMLRQTFAVMRNFPCMLLFQHNSVYNLCIIEENCSRIFYIEM